MNVRLKICFWSQTSVNSLHILHMGIDGDKHQNQAIHG